MAEIGSALSEWLEMILGVSQGSILEPILSKILIDDILHFTNEVDVKNFVDDITLNECGRYLKLVSQKLGIDAVP